ncbi:MAG: isochorismatase family protein [Gemmatimonadaceae bacterium]
MPLTQIDNVSALVVIDLQKGIVAGQTAPHSAADIIGRVARLAAAFREKEQPVVFVNVTGAPPGRVNVQRPGGARVAGWTELVRDLHVEPTDGTLSKQRWGAFIGTSLQEYLQHRGATQIFLAGMSTSIGVESTARSAFDFGYHVVLVTDAMTDRDAEAHHNSVERIFPRLGETELTDNVLQMLKSAS